MSSKCKKPLNIFVLSRNENYHNKKYKKISLPVVFNFCHERADCVLWRKPADKHRSPPMARL